MRRRRIVQRHPDRPRPPQHLSGARGEEIAQNPVIGPLRAKGEYECTIIRARGMYHQGDLRAELPGAAERLLREKGAAAVSLWTVVKQDDE